MKIDEKKILYSFSIDIDKESEEQVEKTKKRKNKETGKMESVKITETKKITKPVKFNVVIKKPNRTQLEDGDMFYSLELNKFIKMGLLTKAMLAKQYGANGGVWTDKEQKIYADLIFKMNQKQMEVQAFSVFSEKGKLSGRQDEKLQSAMQDLADIRKELTEYEMLQNSLFDHTADIKARNRAIMWYILHLTYFSEGDSEEAPLEEMFEGSDFSERYVSYENKEEDADELYERIVDKISSVITIWYISGSQDRDSLEAYLEDMNSEEEVESLDEQPEELNA